ncbi:hypothetical protein DFJ58DRAFT_902831 [Suillus subalutaceus]|uniref:uncharacterized protein n=1 Tax=Suillus subalutaceus TaxID=48586 RepID=UPI001B860184|nr:uncharacterized protein DFJ58DRAFT_902831 [Suillus subalutaceus]KAG1877872.1 hypothetical protein DFJ58DRAFT_902831 [Suillus subalutaceus]
MPLQSMPKRQKQRSGCGIWFEENHPKNLAFRIPGWKHSNQIAELSAILVALQKVELYIPITFVTDSRYTIEGLTKHLPYWEDTEGHNGHQGNEQADTLTKEGASKPTPDELDLSIPDKFNLQGANLSAITQALAYKGIRQKINITPRRKTTNNLDVTRYALQELTGQLETDSTIWTNSRHRDIPRKIRQFLFKVLHGAYKIGDYWTNIPTYEHRARCANCNADDESMEHILTECPSNTKDIWPENFGAWPRINIGVILGCGSASRLLKILIAESAYLIWTMRCDKTILWSSIISKRLQLDRLTARKINRTPSFLKLITSTWHDIITSHDPLPKNWAIALEVFSGY